MTGLISSYMCLNNFRIMVINSTVLTIDFLNIQILTVWSLDLNVYEGPFSVTNNYHSVIIIFNVSWNSNMKAAFTYNPLVMIHFYSLVTTQQNSNYDNENQYLIKKDTYF